MKATNIKFQLGREGERGVMVNLSITGLANLSKAKGTTRYVTTTGVYIKDANSLKKELKHNAELLTIESNIKAMLSTAIRLKELNTITRDSIRAIIEDATQSKSTTKRNSNRMADTKRFKGKEGEWYEARYDNLTDCINLYIDTNGGYQISENKNLVKYGTLKGFKTLITHLNSIKNDLKISDVDQDLINKMERYFSDVSLSTYNRNLKSLKCVLQFANKPSINLSTSSFHTQINYIKKDVDEAQTKNIFSLTKSELVQFWKFNDFDKLENGPRAKIARDLFIFQCMTGLRVSDLNNLKKFEYDGIECINFITTKTNAISKVPLNKTAKAILKRYEGISDYILPIIPSQDINFYIKLIAKELKWSTEVPKYELSTKDTSFRIETIEKYKLMMSKVGRKTFATLLFDNGFEATANQMMGYNPKGIFHKHYAGIKTEQLLNAVRVLEL